MFKLLFDFLEFAESVVHGFRLRARTLTDLAFPVPTLQPTQPNSMLALDLQPTGTPTNRVNDEFTWIDCCDADVMTNNANPVGCAHLGMRSDGAFVGYMSYNGAPVKPLYLGINAVPMWGVNYNGVFYPVQSGVFQIGSDTNRVKDIYVANGSLMTQLASIYARLAAGGL